MMLVLGDINHKPHRWVGGPWSLIQEVRGRAA